jgi:tRNA modification GTPase
MKKRSDTIAAVSTALGKSGIGIIRVSGNASLEVVSRVIHSKIDLLSLTQLKSRKLIYAHLLDHNNSPIDEILVSVMPPDKSFTGEYTVEVNCHGGIAVITYALERILKNGARLAEPGEFTRRAWENGKIDLIKAEAIYQIINSTSLNALKLAWHQFEGGLTNRCNDLRKQLIDSLSYIQFHIDVEGDNESSDFSSVASDINKIKIIIQEMLSCSEKSNSVNNGIWISIYGQPNVGKSSVFNALLKMQRAIVCDQPGTTRDHISELININGFNVRLTDTAGIRETGDMIESESIKKTFEQIKAADILIYVLDISKDVDEKEIKDIRYVLDNDGLVVLNKSDLLESKTINYLISEIDSKWILKVSAKQGENIDKLEKAIEDLINKKFSSNEELIMMTLRQRSELTDCLTALNSIDLSLMKNNLDLLVYDLTSAISSMDKILGIITTEDVLDNVFKNFCVGK